MRRSMILPCLVSILASAQSLPPAPAPVATFPETSFSFGKIAAHQKVTHTFKLKNTGGSLLSIKEVRASCGCTSAISGKMALEPGESTEIQAQFDSGNFQGIVRKSITVTTDDPANPVINLHFDAEVIPEAPQVVRSVFLQDLDRKSVQKTVMRLDSGDGSPVRIKEVRAGDALYLSGVPRGDGGQTFLEIQVDGKRVPAGKTSATDVLTVIPAEEGKAPIEVRVQWEFKPVVVSTPSIVAWAGKPGEPFKSAVKVQHEKGRPFRIVEAKVSNPLLKVDFKKGKAAVHHEVRIALSPEAKAGVYAGESVTLVLDDPDQNELPIRVSAVVR